MKGLDTLDALDDYQIWLRETKLSLEEITSVKTLSVKIVEVNR